MIETENVWCVECGTPYYYTASGPRPKCMCEEALNLDVCAVYVSDVYDEYGEQVLSIGFLKREA
jgi:hypothetical protein